MQTRIEAGKGCVEFGARRIEYVLYRGARKNLRFVVGPDLSVSVYAPERAGAQQIAEAIAKKARWMAKALDKVAAYHPLPAPKHYVSGETFVYLGRQYRLKVVDGPAGEAKLMGRYLQITAGNAPSAGEVRRRVEHWYLDRAQAVFERYLAKCHFVAVRHDVPAPTLHIRKMKRRWGSCTASGRITLNVGLVQVPVHCIEYVIMHELCHMRHHNHGPGFYNLLTRCQPDWRVRKEILDQFKLG